MEDDEHLGNALGLGLVEPFLHVRHLLLVFGTVGVPVRGRAVVVFAAPQEDEARVAVVELVDEVLRRDAKLPDIRHGVERALDLGVAPHFVIADADEPAAVEPGGAHLVIGWGSFFSIGSLTRFQYGLSTTVKPWL